MRLRSLVTASLAVVLTSCAVGMQRTTVTLRSPTAELECYLWVSDEASMAHGLYQGLFDFLLWPFDVVVSTCAGVNAAFHSEYEIDGGPFGFTAAVVFPWITAMPMGMHYVLVEPGCVFGVSDETLASQEGLDEWMRSESPYFRRIEVIRRIPSPTLDLPNFVFDEERWPEVRRLAEEDDVRVVDVLVLLNENGDTARGSIGELAVVVENEMEGGDPRLLRRTLWLYPSRGWPEAGDALDKLSAGERVSVVLRRGPLRDFARLVGPARTAASPFGSYWRPGRPPDITGQPDSVQAWVEVLQVAESKEGGPDFQGVRKVRVRVDDMGWNSVGWRRGQEHTVWTSENGTLGLPKCGWQPVVGERRFLEVSKQLWYASVVPGVKALAVRAAW